MDLGGSQQYTPLEEVLRQVQNDVIAKYQLELQQIEPKEKKEGGVDSEKMPKETGKRKPKAAGKRKNKKDDQKLTTQEGTGNKRQKMEKEPTPPPSPPPVEKSKEDLEWERAGECARLAFEEEHDTDGIPSSANLFQRFWKLYKSPPSY